MDSVRSALYLDFDNVFGGLIRLDPKLAMRFAEEPRAWVSALATDHAGGSPRRWLVLRCYVNPAGWVPHPGNDATRLYFSKFRPFFVDAGFEVIDCPRLSHTKNGADIRLVIDAVDALRAEARYEEFVIASGDSDMTPLLVRLRAADRRTTLLSPSDSAVVLAAVADRLIGSEDFLELLDVQEADLGDALDDEFDRETRTEPGGAATGDASFDLGEQEALSLFKQLVTARYADSTEALNLSLLAGELRRELGSSVSDSDWFGYGGFSRALQALQLPHVRMSQHHMWDSSRHTAPDAVASHLPEAVAQVTQALRLPAAQREMWRHIHESLAAFVAAYEFRMTEATRWCRDRLAEQDLKVNRQVIGLVVKGATYGGCPLYEQPPPAADKIAEAFVANLVKRAAAADVDLSDGDVLIVREWFGAA